MIALIDCGLGNLSSIRHAVAFAGGAVKTVSKPEDLCDAKGVILPGVGAFADAMGKLTEGHWIGALNQCVNREGIPYLGICLGMQVLAERGREGGETPGLGWIDGTVERIELNEPRVRLPHMGWNDVNFTHSQGEINRGIGENGTFYFMHSYSFRTSDASVVAGTADYSYGVTACVAKANIWGTQFHPEKSQKEGIQVLRNFVERVEGKP